jgi:hypothetical protein
MATFYSSAGNLGAAGTGSRGIAMIAVTVIAVFIVGMGVLLFEVLRLPSGIEREHSVRQHKIFSRTRTITHSGSDEVLRLLQTDWSWWKGARAEEIKDLGEGRKEFLFHPLRFFDLFELPAKFLVRLQRIETLADGGKRIHAALTGDFEGPAEYTARPSGSGTIIELAWCGTEVKGVLRFMPLAAVAAVHNWRERLGVEGLRDRLKKVYPEVGRARAHG